MRWQKRSSSCCASGCDPEKAYTPSGQIHRHPTQVTGTDCDPSLIEPGDITRVSLPRERFWDIPVPKIDSPTRQPLLPRPS
ncbi:MAG: hypothetical protein AB2815_08245, partial [Candidatus Sedimenticola endophacoides]